MGEKKVCIYCHSFGTEHSELGWEAWCILDYHDIEKPLKETCDKWASEYQSLRKGRKAEVE